MKLFASALVLLPAVLVMAEEPTFLDTSLIVAKHANSVCDGVVARLAVFGIYAETKACLDTGLTKLSANVKNPSAMTCIDAIAIAKTMGIKANANACIATGNRSQAYEKRDDNYVNIMHNKPPGYPSTPEKPPVYPPKPEEPPCRTCKPPKPPVEPPTPEEPSVNPPTPEEPPVNPPKPEKPPCKTCKPPKPPVIPPSPEEPPVSPPTPEEPPVNPPTPEKPPCKTCKPPRPPVYPPTPGKPCSPKSCEAIIAKMHTLCGIKIDMKFCLNLRINIDFLRLESLKCRVILGAAQIAGVNADLGLCNRLNGKTRVDYDGHNGYERKSKYGNGYSRRSIEDIQYEEQTLTSKLG
ncbi:hypothetical protein K7432_004604 [Basidiobolus ranarum]|uniref:Uncharacterized protein n=1 Tax=Basidiobolus ranarum TaxID=34480 RepID=A0ABR2WY16_9FUNG